MAGGEYTINVQDRKLTYQLNQLFIMEPVQAGELYVMGYEDFGTPDGISSHQPLVRESMGDNSAEEAIIHVTSDAEQFDPMIMAPLTAVPLLLAALVILIVPGRRKT